MRFAGAVAAREAVQHVRALFGAQQLATINKKTGRAHLFGVPVPGLAVMAMAFGPHGTLYAVGGCNLDPVTFECTPGPPT